MRNIALEIPLVPFALGRRRKSDHAADTRVEALGYALDRAALAGGVAAFEKHHDLELLVLDPVLKTNQLMLQAEEFAEVKLAVERLLGRAGHAFSNQLVEPVLLHLHFQLLVEAVGDFVLDTVELSVFDHGALPIKSAR